LILLTECIELCVNMQDCAKTPTDKNENNENKTMLLL